MRLRVLTVNVQNDEGDPRRTGLLNRELRRLEPDLVALQEVRYPGRRDQLAELVDGTGLHPAHPGHRRRLDYVFVGSAHAHPRARARIVAAELIADRPCGRSMALRPCRGPGRPRCLGQPHGRVTGS